MAALDSSLQEPYTVGENGRNQYDWSKNLKNQLVQIQFQLVRKDKKYTVTNTDALDEFEEIYKYYYNKKNNIAGVLHFEESVRVLNILKRLTAFTRDIINGKGEYMLGIEMIHRISKHDPDSAKVLIHFFIT